MRQRGRKGEGVSEGERGKEREKERENHILIYQVKYRDVSTVHMYNRIMNLKIRKTLAELVFLGTK